MFAVTHLVGFGGGVITETGGAGISYTLSASTDNFDLYSYLVGAALYNGTSVVTVTFTISAGVVVGSASSSTPALLINNFPVGSTITINNAGDIDGAGGAGGAAGTGGAAVNGAAGTQGGTALKTTVNITVNNTGRIRGGGGGGGGGGTSWYYIVEPEAAQYLNGGTGGRGAGDDGAAAAGSAGETGGGYNAGDGGTGGAFGVNGSNGISGHSPQSPPDGQPSAGSGGAGGAAGYYADGYSKITWTATGTVAGLTTG